MATETVSGERETKSMRLTAEAATEVDVDQSGINRSRAVLRCAVLRGADLSGADMRGADLRAAYDLTKGWAGEEH